MPVGVIYVNVTTELPSWYVWEMGMAALWQEPEIWIVGSWG